MNEFVMLPLIVPWEPTLWSSRERGGETNSCKRIQCHSVHSWLTKFISPKGNFKDNILKTSRHTLPAIFFKVFKFTHSVNNVLIRRKKTQRNCILQYIEMLKRFIYIARYYFKYRREKKMYFFSFLSQTQKVNV